MHPTRTISCDSRALARPELLGSAAELEHSRVAVDADEGLLTVTDNGIGMSRDEVIENLGTIARSGTGQFLERFSGDQRKDCAADRAVRRRVLFRVHRRGRGDRLSPPGRCAARNRACAGSRMAKASTASKRSSARSAAHSVQLKLKADAAEFLQAGALARADPQVLGPHRVPREDVDGGRRPTRPVNRAKALWARAARRDQGRRVRGVLQAHRARLRGSAHLEPQPRRRQARVHEPACTCPSVAPFDLWNRESPKGVKLYVQRVFITDQATQFLPLYLRFVRGVVDSSELSLNVSRELLQQDEAIGAMRNALTKRVLDMLERLAEESAEKYATFWSQFGVS